MRVLATHHYSLAHMRERVRAGDFPAQQLWGADALAAAGHDVELGFLGPRDRRLLRTTELTAMRFGHLDEQLGLWRRRAEAGVVYAGEASLVRALAVLPRRPPLVAVVHDLATSSARAAALAVDVAICLSQRTHDELVAAGRPPADTPVLPWGPDLDFPGYAPPPRGERVVSTGRTRRDLTTLRAALARLGDPPASLPAPGAHRDYPEVLAELRRAAVVAIPLSEPERLTGLSEVADALALGLPFVITRSPHLDLDPDAVGCGITVAPGDVDGWTAALRALLADPDRRAAMGAAGRAHAERHRNAGRFGAGVVSACARPAAARS